MSPTTISAGRTCGNARPRSDTVQCRAVPSRRQVGLMLGSGLALLASQPALEAAAECRAAGLLADSNKQQSYTSAAQRAATAERTASGVPVAELGDEYGKATVALAGKIDQYFTMDVYDKKRVPLIKSLKEDSNSWVSRYARGGSVRKLSARKMYVALDAIQGHLASSGLAPFPVGKQKAVNSNITEAIQFLGEGR